MRHRIQEKLLCLGDDFGIWEEVAQTVADPGEVDDGIRHLLRMWEG